MAAGRGELAGYFSALAFKTMAAVEADPRLSNQHEFNGTRALQLVFGTHGPQRLDTEFVWMPDDGEFVRHSGVMTWYDARASHPVRSEFRLYYPTNEVTRRARAGDLVLIARRACGSCLLLLAPGSGTAAARIAWMFGVETAPGAAFSAMTLSGEERDSLAEIAGDPGGASGWAADDFRADLPQDPSIRASVLVMQRELGEERVTNILPGWSVEAG